MCHLHSPVLSCHCVRHDSVYCPFSMFQNSHLPVKVTFLCHSGRIGLQTKSIQQSEVGLPEK